LGAVARVASKSKERKMGNPAFISVFNCWLRIRKSLPPIFRSLRKPKKPLIRLLRDLTE
jgi:hypothetical protein